MQMLGHGHQSEINMTPMIDVLLTLIVVFIVLVQIRFVHDVQIPPPTLDRRAQVGDEHIVLELKPGGGYEINTRPVSPWALRQVLSGIFRHRPVKILYVRVGMGWNYAAVMSTIDVAHAAGVEDIAYVPVR